MIPRQVAYSPEARADLLVLYNHIADAASPQIALAYVLRLESWLAGFDISSERGTPRDDIRPGLRTIGFERRITVAFAANPTRVTILRLFYGGQDWSAALTRA